MLALAVLLMTSSAARADDWVDRIARVLGISKTPSQQKSPAPSPSTSRRGDVYVVQLGGGAPHLVAAGEYRSPIFLPGGVALLALDGSRLVRISVEGGNPEPLRPYPGILKLLGADGGDPDKVLVLLEHDRRIGVATVSLGTGVVTPIPHDPNSPEHRKLVLYLRGDARKYGDVELWTKVEFRRRGGVSLEWTDVFVQQAGIPPYNVSACDGDDCVEPAVAPGRDRVAYVRVKRGGVEGR
jgi:hypothetical protein